MAGANWAALPKDLSSVFPPVRVGLRTLDGPCIACVHWERVSPRDILPSRPCDRKTVPPVPRAFASLPADLPCQQCRPENRLARDASLKRCSSRNCDPYGRSLTVERWHAAVRRSSCLQLPSGRAPRAAKLVCPRVSSSISFSSISVVPWLRTEECLMMRFSLPPEQHQAQRPYRRNC